MPRKLSDRAKAELETLQEMGISLTWDDVVEIAYLCEQVESPECRQLSARGEPVEVGGHWLWPLTRQASAYFRKWVDVFSSHDEQVAFLAYCMASGRSADMPMCLASRQAARDAVRSFSESLACTDSELIIAVHSVIERMQQGELEIPENAKSKDIRDDDDKQANDIMSSTAFLVASTGLPAEYWEREVSTVFAREQIRQICAQAGGKPQKDDPRIIAEQNLGWALIKIERRKKNGDAS